MTRDPRASREADDANGPHDASGPLDARRPAARDRWSDTVPGYEFEGGHSPSSLAAPGPDGGPSRGDPYTGDPYTGDPYTSDPYSDNPYGSDPYRRDYDTDPYTVGRAPGPPMGDRAGDRTPHGRVLRAEPDGESQTFRYTPVVSQPLSVPSPSWSRTGGRRATNPPAPDPSVPDPSVPDPLAPDPPAPGRPTTAGSGFDDQGWFVPPPGTGPFGPIPVDEKAEPTARRPASANAERTPAGRAARNRAGHNRAARSRAARNRAAATRSGPAHPPRTRATWRPAAGDDGARRDAAAGPGSQRDAYTEWASLLGTFVPDPIRRRWSSDFRAALSFRGWGLRVVIPILAAVIFGVSLVTIKGVGNSPSAPAPSASSLGYPPASLAGADFTASGGGRGIDQSLGSVASAGSEVVAVGSQTGARIARAQFFVSVDGGRTWTLGTTRSASGGPPPPGHAATFVAGGNGAWIAVGPEAIWTSADGRTWTLAPGTGLPLRPGDQISSVERTAAGYIAAGDNVPDGQAAKSTPVVFLSTDGTTWQRLDAGRLHLAAGTGRVVDLRSAAAAGNQILISGDIVTTSTGKHGRAQTVRQGGAWLSRDGGSAWTPALTSAAAPAGHGATGQITAVAAAGQGFVLFRPATAAGNSVVDVYTSSGGTTWKFVTTLATAIGFTPDFAQGGPGGVVITGRAGRQLTSFASVNGRTWQQAGPFATTAAETLSGAALADGTVDIAGTGQAQPDSQQPAITRITPGGTAAGVDIAAIPGATTQQVAVNALAARGSTQVAVGSANGYPAAWTSADGGASWTRATGATSAVLTRPGSQQLTSVTHGTAGWLAVGGVTAGTAGHPVVVTSADGGSWQAADTETTFAGSGLVAEQAAASAAGYIIVGYQQTGQGKSERTIAAAWWSAGLTGWQRAGDAAAGALDGTGASRQMLAVTAGADGYVAVGSHGSGPSVWTSADGRTWSQADLPEPAGATQAVLQHVASTGQAVTAVGTATTSSGQQVPFAASSGNAGRTWTETILPQPQGPATVTALTAAGHGFVVTGTYGTSPAHQDVLVWTSPNGASWTTALPTGRGLTGSGVQAITGLTASGSTLSGVGFTASPTTNTPTFWQSPIR